VCTHIKDITNHIQSGEFCRIHRSYCINLNHIRNYKRSDQEVEMTNGHRFGVARRKKTLFEKQVSDFWNLTKIIENTTIKLVVR
jgi:DNA-binding LytR/AlgR family response regulator